MNVLDKKARWGSTDDDRQPVTTGALVVCAGLLGVLLLVSVIALYTRLGDVQAGLAAKTSAEELARTRYEAEVQMLHDIKVKLDTIDAWYQQDVHMGVPTTFTKRRH